MLTWISGFFKRSPSTEELKTATPKKVNEDWMVISSDLKSCTESEHFLNSTKSTTSSNLNKTKLSATVNAGAVGHAVGRRKHKMEMNRKANEVLAANSSSLLTSEKMTVGLPTGDASLNINNGINHYNSHPLDNILINLKDRELKLKKDKKLSYRNNKKFSSLPL